MERDKVYDHITPENYTYFAEQYGGNLHNVSDVFRIGYLGYSVEGIDIPSLFIRILFDTNKHRSEHYYPRVEFYPSQDALQFITKYKGMLALLYSPLNNVTPKDCIRILEAHGFRNERT